MPAAMTLLFVLLCQPSSSPVEKDLRWIEANLPKLQLDFDRIVPPAEWHRRCQVAAREMTQLSGTSQTLRLVQLVSSIGVAHTWLNIGDQPVLVLPIRIKPFSDGIYVYATSKEFSELAGAKVLSIGGKRPAQIIDRLGGLEPNENVQWRRAKVADWCGAGDSYLATGLSRSASEIEFSFLLSNGKRSIRRIPATLARPTVTRSIPQEQMPPFMRRLDVPYQIVRDPKTNSLILEFRRCEASEEMSMETLTQTYWNVFRQEGFRNAVVDLRLNGGGDSRILAPFIRSLSSQTDVVRNRRLFAFISEETFSSGMMNAVQLREQGAILLGQPTGGSPNSYGEQKSVPLPNTGMTLTYCTKFFQLDKDRNARTVKPDVSLPFNWSDYVSGRDPALAEIAKRS